MTALNHLTQLGFHSHHMEADFAGMTLDASNDGVGFGFQSMTTDAITHLGFRIGDRAGTPPTYIIGLEGIASTGFPDGTYLGGGSPASATFTPPADSSWNSSWRWIALANSYNPSHGEFLMMTIRHSSGTVDGSNNQTVFLTNKLAGSTSRGFPSALTLTAGTWARSPNPAMFGYRTASGRYGFIAVNATADSTSTSGRRVAAYYTIPSTIVTSVGVRAFRLACSTPAAAATFKAGIWDSAGTMIHEATFDSDNFTPSNSNDALFVIQDASLTGLVAGSKYYFGLESVSSSSVGVRGALLQEADDRYAYPDGMNRGAATWNGSAWTDNNLSMPHLILYLEDITAPSAVAGGNPNLLAGLARSG